LPVEAASRSDLPRRLGARVGETGALHGTLLSRPNPVASENTWAEIGGSAAGRLFGGDGADPRIRRPQAFGRSCNFSSASFDFKTLGAFFCNAATLAGSLSARPPERFRRCVASMVANASIEKRRAGREFQAP
jgi:hypothetical protein